MNSRNGRRTRSMGGLGASGGAACAGLGGAVAVSPEWRPRQGARRPSSDSLHRSPGSKGAGPPGAPRGCRRSTPSVRGVPARRPWAAVLVCAYWSRPNMPDFASVDDYISRQPPAAQAMLRELREAVRAAIPEAEEGISGYNLPTYKVGGKGVVYFGAAKQHCALYGVTRDGFRSEEHTSELQ